MNGSVFSQFTSMPGDVNEYRHEPRPCRDRHVSVSQSLLGALKTVQGDYFFYHLLLIVFLTGVNAVWSQRQNVYFDHLTIEDGLSQSSVHAVIQDRYGFMWFGTAGGLNKYDGYSIERYTHNLLDSTTIANDWITQLYEDASGRIWVGTAGGLSMYHPLAHHFSSVRLDDQGVQGISVVDVLSDTSGRVWVATRQGLFRYDPNTGQSKLIISTPVTALCGESPGTFWIGTPDSLFLASWIDGSHTEYSVGISVTSLRRDHAGHLWIASNNGLYRLDRSRTHLESITLLGKQLGKEPRILKLYEDRGGWLWLGTASHGLLKMDPKREKIIAYTYDHAGTGSLGRGEVQSIFEDRTGIMWVGTSIGGISKLSKTRGRFKVARHENGEGILDHNIWSITEDRDGNLWFSTESGLCFLDRGANSYRHVTIEGASKRLFHIHEDPSGSLWLGGTDGLSRMDRETRAVRHYRHRDGDSTGLSKGDVRAVLPDGDVLWVGTSTGLDRLDLTTETFSRSLPVRGAVQCLSNDVQGNLWVGTMSGLYRIDPSRSNVTTFERTAGGEDELSHQFILSIYPEPGGDVWIGTYGGGLNRFDAKTQTFESFSYLEGVGESIVYGILPGNDRYLWLSTNRGLVRFDPVSRASRTYDVSDGLSSNEFNQGAYCRTRAGELFFGNINGYVSFFPDEIRDNQYVPPVLVTAFKKFDRVIRFEQPIWEMTDLQLPYDDNFFSFEFAALDFNNPSKNRYAYKLEGFDNSWIYCGTRRYASYTNLSPGQYVFRVIASNDDLVWNDRGFAIRVTIVPPFWRTWWFYAIVVVIVILAAVGLHEYRVRQEVKQTLAIQKARIQESERVRKKAADDFHDEFGHKLTKITLLCEVMKNDMQDRRPETVDVLNKIINTSKTLSIGMRDFLWTMNPEKDSLYEAAVRLKDFGDDLFDRSGVAFTVDGLTPVMESVKLTMEWRRNLTLIFKEAMNNILKHARSRNVHLEFGLSEGHVNIRLSDDGVGFSSANGSAGHGLFSMRNRAQKLHAELSIQSSDEIGTVVHFRGPLHVNSSPR